MSKPSQEEILKSIRRSYLLGKAFAAEAIWLKNYLKPEEARILNDAKAKVNFYTSKAHSTLSPEAKEIIEEKGYELLDKLLDEI